LAAEQAADWVCNNVDTFIDNHNREFSIGFSTVGTEVYGELKKIEDAFLGMGISESDQGINRKLLEKVGAQLPEQELANAKFLMDGYNSGGLVSVDAVEEINDRLKEIAGEEYEEGDVNESIEDEGDKLDCLYDIVGKVKECLVNNKILLKRIYDKLIFYYELCGFREGHKIERDLVGHVKIGEFVYYPYELPISSTAKIPRVDDEGNPVLDDEGNQIIDIGDSVIGREPPQYHIDIAIDFWENRPQMSMF
jgi:hypothetical protein